jgi:hypothetical protein
VTVAPVDIARNISSSSRWLIVSSILLAASLILYGEELASSALPKRAVVWGALALASYGAGLLCLIAVGRGSGFGLARWRFGPWMLLWYGLTFGLATVTWSGPQASTASQIALSSVLRALWLVAVGMTFLVIGYLLGPSHALRRLADRRIAALGRRCTGTVRSGVAPWLTYAIGVTARIAGIATTGRFGYVGDVSSTFSSATGYEQILSELSLLCPLALCAAAIQVYRERMTSARLTLTILFVAELAFAAASAGKQNIVVAVLAVVIPMSAARYRLPKMAVGGCVLLFLVIAIPFNQAYRNVAHGVSTTLSTSQAIDDAPAILRQSLTTQSLATALPDSTTYLLQRLQEIDGPAIILQRTPAQIPFSSALQLVEAPLVDIVPRAIWTNKPILASGYAFSQQYYGLPATEYTSSAISPIGDLYRHGGWIPVMLGMLFLGCGVRLLDDVLDIRANPHAIFLILLLFPGLVKGEDDWVAFMAGIPATIVIWLLAVALIFGVRRST